MEKHHYRVTLEELDAAAPENWIDFLICWKMRQMRLNDYKKESCLEFTKPSSQGD
jgi:hypothetical protein